MFQYVTIDDKHAHAEKANDDPCIDVQKGKTKDSVVWVVPLGIIRSWSNPAENKYNSAQDVLSGAMRTRCVQNNSTKSILPNPAGAIVKLHSKSSDACAKPSADW